MDKDAERAKKRAATRALHELVARSYAPGRYVAVDAGLVIADAASFDELTENLQAIGRDSPEVLVVQAGVEPPDFVYIL